MLQLIYYFNKLILDGISTLRLRQTYSGVQLDAYAAALIYERNNVLLSDSASFLKVSDVEHIENLNCRTGAAPKILSPTQLIPVKCQLTGALRRKLLMSGQDGRVGKDFLGCWRGGTKGATYSVLHLE